MNRFFELRLYCEDAVERVGRSKVDIAWKAFSTIIEALAVEANDRVQAVRTPAEYEEICEFFFAESLRRLHDDPAVGEALAYWETQDVAYVFLRFQIDSFLETRIGQP